MHAVLADKKDVPALYRVPLAVEDMFSHAVLDIGDFQILVAVIDEGIRHEYGFGHDDALALFEKIVYVIVIHNASRAVAFSDVHMSTPYYHTTFFGKCKRNVKFF